MGCTRRASRKYTSRPSPAFSAQDCKGLTKKGSDGQDYVSKADARGIYRWTRKGGSGASGKKYETHYNGSRPFAVYDNGHQVTIFAQDYDEETDHYVQGKKVLTAAYKKIWIGKDPLGITYEWEPGMVGNSILVQTAGNKYIFIGDKIYSFKLKDGDAVVQYLSPVGNNDVPYPYIIGKDNVYLLLEEKILQRDIVDLSMDVYAQYYGNKYASKGKGTIKIPEKYQNLEKHAVNLTTKVIQKRIL